MSEVNERNIYVLQRDIQYPGKEYAFSPSEKYPEYPYSDESIAGQPNEVYKAIRDAFIMMGLDQGDVGTAQWNPLGEFIKPGDRVVLKPNMVLDRNHIEPNGTECLITHPSVVRAVLDYVLIALKGTGEVIVGDAPVQSCNFERLAVEQGYDQMTAFYNGYGVSVRLKDFRLTKAVMEHGMVNTLNVEDAEECTTVNLGSLSVQADGGYDRLRVTNYNPDHMRLHHNEREHEYMIATQVLEADVIINLPKPKTHRKAGMTGALKNMVGINGNKDWLPHHKKGAVSSGGDEYKNRNIFKSIEANLLDYTNRKEWKSHICPQILRIVRKASSVLGNLTASDKYHEGSWYGNDTIWRTIVDLNRILLYADKSGKMKNEKQRKIFIIGDMIVSGEGEGPLMPTPIYKGILLFGWNAVAFDTVVADIMGFDYEKIPSIYKCFGQRKFPLINFDKNDIEIKTKLDGNELEGRVFIPTSGWKGHIEKNMMADRS